MPKVSSVELLRLLNYLQNKPTRIKFRMSDRIWQTEFLNIRDHSPGMVYVHDGKNFSGITLKDVAEFELEEPLEGFDAGVRYEV
jgi:hypothetical protein